MTLSARPPASAPVTAPEEEPAAAALPDAPAVPGERPTLFLSEIVVGGLVVAVGLLAWVALALAHLGWFSLGAALGVWAVVVLGLGFGVVRYAPARIRVDRSASAGVVVLALIAGVMFFPGFRYGVTDKDPGGYVAHAMAISRTGNYELIDPTLDGRLPHGPVLYSPGARFAGVWLRDTTSDVVIPQFYHLWPALLAVGDSAAGEAGLGDTAPILGVLALLAAALALRRAVVAAPWGTPAAGLACGGIAGLLLATNMLEVWQAKYPSSEISAQMLFLGSLLAVVLAVTTRWRPAAAAAGLLTGIGFLDRGDGILLVGLAVTALALLIAIRRWDARATWFAAGLAVVMPHALWQAYSYDAAGRYTADNRVPSLPVFAVAVVVVLVLGVALRPAGPRVAGFVTRPRNQPRIGAVVTAGAALLLALGYLRPRLFGESTALISGRVQRTYDEQILARLSWFVSMPGFLLMLVGVAIVALRRWGAALWVLTVPLLLFFPVYAYKAQNSTRLMWWSRRYLPNVLPLVLVLIALALGVGLTLGLAALRRRPALVWGTRAVALGCTAALAVWFLGQSAPLRSHSEFGGSFAISARIAKAADGKQGVFLWQFPPACCLYAEQLFGSATWLERGQISALLPMQPGYKAGYIRDFEKAFPGQPVFVVWHTQADPAIPGVKLEPVDRITTTLPYWEESNVSRPDHAVELPVDFAIYRVISAG